MASKNGTIRDLPKEASLRADISTSVLKEWICQYVFPAKSMAVDPRSGKARRHHLHENLVQRAVKKAAILAGIHKLVGCHTLRHYATHLLEAHYDIRTVQELLGHAMSLPP